MPNSWRQTWEDYRKLRRQLGAPGALWYLYQRSRGRFEGPGAPYRMLSRNARYPVLVRPETSDFQVFRQIFCSREYRCLNDLNHADLVIDCGANVGYSAAWFLTRFPKCQLIAVEPDPGNFAMLRRNLAPYGRRARLVNSAVWSNSTGLRISEIPYRDGREWSVQVRPCRAQEKADLQAVDIATLLRDSGQSRISILKIDIEAAESAVFAEHYEAWLDRVDHLVIELHDEHCQAVFARAMAGRPFEFSRMGELTVCRRQHASDPQHRKAA